MTNQRGVPDRAAIEEADFMTLQGEPCSKSAISFVADIAQGVHDLQTEAKRPRPSAAFLRATGAFLCDLIATADRDPAALCWRSLDANSFRASGGHTHKTVYPLVSGLRSVGFLDHFTDPDGAWAARFRATSKLLRTAAGYGVTPKDWRDHFYLPPLRPAVLTEPLILRATKRPWDYMRRGRSLFIAPDDAVAAVLRGRVARLNDFMIGHEFAPVGHQSFRRVFALGDLDDYQWNKGGRIVSIGKSYQNAKRALREALTIDGEETAEIDVTASHLTILHGLMGLPFDASNDPYMIEGIPRGIVKAWVTMTLGYVRFHKTWTKEKREELQEEAGGDVADLFPISSVRKAVLLRHPAMTDWNKNVISWADLQYVESRVMLRTMETLAFDHGVVCLPVHDSIVVPGSKRELAWGVLERAFKAEVGLVPSLKGKQRGVPFNLPQ